MSQHDNRTKSNLRLFSTHPSAEASLADITKSFMEAADRAEKADQRPLSRFAGQPDLSIWRNNKASPSSQAATTTTPLKIVK